jgi:hypothetical protein
MNSLTFVELGSGTRIQASMSELRDQNRSLFERILPVVVFVFCLAYLCVPLRYCSLEPDEGIVLQGADRVLHGQVPYQDFFSFYTPGSFYFLALWFRVFGDSFAAARSSIAITGALCSVFTYLLARRVCGPGVSLLVAILATMVGTGFRFLVLHNWYSTLLCCLTLYAALRFIESANAVWPMMCAFCASLTLLFEQSKGAGLCFGMLLALLLLRIGPVKIAFSRSALFGALLGFGAPLLATFAYFGAHQSTGVMVQNWLWPLRHYTRANHVAYGYQNWSDAERAAIFHAGPLWTRAVKVLAVSPDFLIPMLPLIGLILLICFAVQLWRNKNTSGNMQYYILVCSVSSGLLVSVVMTRADILHFIYLAPILYVVLSWVLDTKDLSSGLLQAVRPYLVGYVAIAFGLLGAAVLLSSTGAHNRIGTRRGTIITAGRDSVLEYVESRIPAESELLVYPYLPLYNYLTATRSPSGYDYFQPGMNTREQAQEILAALKSSHSRAVLFEPWFAEKIADSWPRTPPRAIAEDPVADYIAEHYQVCKMLGSGGGWRFHFMVRKQDSCT